MNLKNVTHNKKKNSMALLAMLYCPTLTPLVLLHSSVNTHATSTHNACMQHAHISTATVWGYSLLSCSASSNIFSGCCVCTHRNHVITACQGFLCKETFAYLNVLKSEACHGWFSNVHNHIVGLCICSAQLIDASGSLFAAFFQFTIK